MKPIGDYRSSKIVCLEGKRKKKRAKQREDFTEGSFSANRTPLASPEIQNFVTIGFNSTTRYLEMLAHSNLPSTFFRGELDNTFRGSLLTPELGISSGELLKGHRPLVAVFITHAEQSSVIHAHLPVLIKTASLALSSAPATLVELSKGAEACLCKALQLSRISVIGLMGGAPGASELIESIRTRVPAVEISWLGVAKAGQFLPTKTKAIHTSNLNGSKKIVRDRSLTDPKEILQPVN